MPWFSVPRIPRGPCRGRWLGEARKHITRGSVPRPMPSDVRGELRYLGKKVLLALKDLGKASPDEVQARGRFGELVEVMNAASWLQAKGLLTMGGRGARAYRLARWGLARRPGGRFGDLVGYRTRASGLQARALLTMGERVERSYRLARGALPRRQEAL